MLSGSISNRGATWSSCEATPARGCAVEAGTWLEAAVEVDENRFGTARTADVDEIRDARVQLKMTRTPMLRANISGRDSLTRAKAAALFPHR